MPSRRQLKAAEAIREVVATAILTELRDPRIEDVTVLGVEIDSDLRNAKVSVSVMGDEKKEQLSLRGLQSSAGFLQSKVAERIDTRYTPRLTFEIDRGQENAMAVHEILNQLRKERGDDESSEDEPSVEGETPN